VQKKINIITDESFFALSKTFSSSAQVCFENTFVNFLNL